MKKFLKGFQIIFTVVISALAVSCREKVLPPQVHVCMDTVCSVNLYDDGTEKLYKEIFLRLDELEKQFSVTIPESYVSQLNRSAGSGPIQISKEMFDVLEVCRKVSDISGGAFDITMNPVIQLWGINTEKVRVPEQKEIIEALEKVGYDRMHFADDGVRWAILERGMGINLGAVAKGFAADEIVKVLEFHGVKKAVINLGGNIYCYGKKEDRKLWSVGIKNPKEPEGTPLLKVTTDETSVVTSGNYERFFEQDGKRYHHIFDPKTGFPSDNSIASVTVICKNSTAADALSTACFVMGKGNAFFHLKDFENYFGTEIGLVFIMENGEIRASENLKGKLEFYDSSNEGIIGFLYDIYSFEDEK